MRCVFVHEAVEEQFDKYNDVDDANFGPIEKHLLEARVEQEQQPAER